MKEGVLKKNMRTWVMFAGILLIVVACLMAYLNSRPAEANLALQIPTPSPPILA